MNKRIFRPKQSQAGFSLIEVMVAVIIGMIAMVVVLQIFGSSEARKRATTGGNDAQTGGLIALNTLQRDVRQAGYGITTLKLLGCNLAVPKGTISGLAPVIINSGSIPKGDDDTDTLLVAYGVANGSPEGDVINTVPGSGQYAVATPTSYNVNDWVIAEQDARPSPCNLALDQVTAKAAPGTATIGVAKGSSDMAFGTLYNLGANSGDKTLGPQFLGYRVSKGNLVMCDFMANDCSQDNTTAWVPIASNIVSMRAQYGRDTTPKMDGVIDVFDRVAPAVSGDTNACDILRIAAVRIALVARSGDYDKSTPTANAPVWDGTDADNPAGSEALPIKLSANTDWQKYRYKVFQTTVPIRATTWLGPKEDCSP